jgi:hypothetical protein
MSSSWTFKGEQRKVCLLNASCFPRKTSSPREAKLTCAQVHQRCKVKELPPMADGFLEQEVGEEAEKSLVW